jgi:hypothetical protein
MSDKSPAVSANTEVDAFLTEMEGVTAKTTASGGRLVFALDATASRQPTWDTACELQAEMFREVAVIGGLSVQLVIASLRRKCRLDVLDCRLNLLVRQVLHQITVLNLVLAISYSPRLSRIETPPPGQKRGTSSARILR